VQLWFFDIKKDYGDSVHIYAIICVLTLFNFQSMSSHFFHFGLMTFHVIKQDLVFCLTKVLAKIVLKRLTLCLLR
jgi:hypothetical protein